MANKKAEETPFEVIEEPFEKEMDVLVRARENIVWVDTYELERASQSICEVASNLIEKGGEISKHIVYRWDNLVGFKIEYMDEIEVSQNLKLKHDALMNKEEPIFSDRVFEEIYKFLSVAEEEGIAVIFILDNFHLFLVENALNITQFFTLHEHLKAHKATVVVNSPIVNVPTELIPKVTVIKLQYPQDDFIESKVSGFIKRVEDRGFDVELTKREREILIKSFSGLITDEIDSTLAKIFAKHKKINSKAIKMVLDEKKQILSKNKVLLPVDNQVDFKDVGGYKNLINWLLKREKGYSPEAKAFGLPTPRGVFLIGLPGTGKSLCAKALASLLHQPLYRLDFGSLFGNLVGQSEENIRKAQDLAEALSPCLLWVDEIDKALSDTSGGGDSGTSSRVFASFLTWLQEKEKPVFVVCTANDMKLLKSKPELLRSGRFDEKFFLDLPNDAERKQILNIHLNKAKVKVPDKGLDVLVKESDGFSGAEIECAIMDSKYTAFFENEKNPKVGKEQLVTAFKETIPLSKSMEEQIDFNRKWASGRFKPASENAPVSSVHKGVKKKRKNVEL